MENIAFGLQLMAVGMCTVFVILLTVVQGGKLLVRLVNRIAPEETPAPPKARAATAPTAIDANTMAVLQQVVSQLTGGKGHVASARKV